METLRGGLVSTLEDYTRFSQMLLSGGSLDGRRVLREETIKLMTEVNHLGIIFDKPGATMGSGDSRGWGLLGSIELPDANKSSDVSYWPGRCGWGGWAGTMFRILPGHADVSLVFMTNCIGWDTESLLHSRLSEAAAGLRSGAEVPGESCGVVKISISPQEATPCSNQGQTRRRLQPHLRQWPGLKALVARRRRAAAIGSSAIFGACLAGLAQSFVTADVAFGHASGSGTATVLAAAASAAFATIVLAAAAR